MNCKGILRELMNGGGQLRKPSPSWVSHHPPTDALSSGPTWSELPPAVPAADKDGDGARIPVGRMLVDVPPIELRVGDQVASGGCLVAITDLRYRYGALTRKCRCLKPYSQVIAM